MDEKLNTSNQSLMTEAVNDVLKTTNPADAENFIKKVGEKFIENKIRDFPNLCNEMRRVNYLMQKQFSADGSDGWVDPNKKNFKHDYTIPKELYNFMVNLIYRNFWEEDNEKIWRPFLRCIMRGDEPMDLLRRTRMKFETGINDLV